ncbi:MAG: Xaa-Pro aminopeptidase [Gammaproteobacteria bacterium RIFCSPHIGHO2_12_FULL_38_14]|nr:MAG: Xaa-Pro aminopeptidase [Gammaproteobacteria bacterium RIFCSPHIGHO2_12_FULL_38_14]
MLKMTEYAKRRKILMQQVGPNGIAILPSAHEIVRNGDALYPFRQNSDFLYLTGFNEPEAIALFIPHRKAGEFILFNRVRDPDREIWDGPRAGQEGACQDFHADQAFPIHQFQSMLPELLSDRESLYFPIGTSHCLDEMIMEAVNQIRAKVRAGVQSPIAFFDITVQLHEMRLIKSQAELSIMQQAVDITKAGHLRAMEVCKPGQYEYELEAELIYAFQTRGARYHAYNPIVASGSNACILHYIANNRKMMDGDLVLIDAGCEYQSYASDITRTFPVNGKFSGEQRAIYDLVLTAQEAAINAIKPGVSWTLPQEKVVKIITQGLIDLGILKGRLPDLIEKEAYFPFYMHRSGHWLGLDVHDAGRYKMGQKWRPLQEGMVFTVEPGLYIPSLPNVPKRFHHIGVRIEDDVVVTEKGCKVLSESIPKKSSEIEAIMAK